MKLVRGFGFVVLTVAAVISSLLVALFSVALPGLSDNLWQFRPSVAIRSVCGLLMLVIASLSILLLQWPTVPSLLCYKLVVTGVVAATTTACIVLLLGLQVKFWNDGSGGGAWFRFGFVFSTFVALLISKIQWSVFSKQRNQHRVYVANEKTWKRNG
jgi:hypothetical protein